MFIQRIKNIASRFFKADTANQDKKDSFCVMPWKHMHINNNGSIRLCCQTPWLLDDHRKPLTVYEYTVDEIWNSEQMRAVRRAMVLGEKIKECSKCWQVEARGGISRRMNENNSWQVGYVTQKGISLDDLKTQAIQNDFYVDHRPFDFEMNVGNLCNLKCRMCSGDWSSKIEHDPVHGRWQGKNYDVARWRQDVAVIGPKPIVGAFYEGFFRIDDSSLKEIFWTQSAARVAVPNVRQRIGQLRIQFSDSMPAENQVSIYLNGQCLYKGYPVHDGLSGHWDLTGFGFIKDVDILIESTVAELQSRGKTVGAGIEKIEIQRIPGKEQKRTNNLLMSRFPEKVHWFKERGFVFKELLRDPQKVQKIQFLGGEPMIVKEVLEVIDFLSEQGDPKNLILSFVTNGTVYEPKLFERAAKYKQMVIAVSLDAVGDYYEYIRYPAKWEKVVNNVLRFLKAENINLFIAATFQAYNALNIVDLFRFCDDYGLDIQVNSIRSPDYLAAAVLPPKARALAAKRLKDYAESDCREENKNQVMTLARELYMKGDTINKDALEKFMLFTNDLDKSRNQDFGELYKEMTSLMEEDGMSWKSKTLYAAQ